MFLRSKSFFTYQRHVMVTYGKNHKNITKQDTEIAYIFSKWSDIILLSSILLVGRRYARLSGMRNPDTERRLVSI